MGRIKHTGNIKQRRIKTRPEKRNIAKISRFFVLLKISDTKLKSVSKNTF